MNREAQAINVVNIEGIIDELIPYRFGGTPKAERWVRTAVKKAITHETNWKTDCAALNIMHQTCITAREAQLIELLRSSMPMGSPFPSATYMGRVLTQSDYLRYPWLGDAVLRGDNLVMMNISENSKNVIDHLCEVVMVRYPHVEDPAVLSLSQVRAESTRWQRQLERQAEKAEGHVAQLGTLDDGKEVWLLLDQQAFAREGKAMRHCVGSYVPKPGLAIVSVRDEESSLVTIELKVTRDVSTSSVEYPLIDGDAVDIVQMRGPQNASVPDDMKKAITDFLRTICTVRKTEGAGMQELGDLMQTVFGIGLGNGGVFVDRNRYGIGVLSGMFANRVIHPGDVVRISDLMANDGSGLANQPFSPREISRALDIPESLLGADLNNLSIPVARHESVSYSESPLLKDPAQPGDPEPGTELPPGSSYRGS